MRCATPVVAVLLLLTRPAAGFSEQAAHRAFQQAWRDMLSLKARMQQEKIVVT